MLKSFSQLQFRIRYSLPTNSIEMNRSAHVISKLPDRDASFLTLIGCYIAVLLRSGKVTAVNS